MPHRRQKSPGSFQDELDGLIERVAPPEPRPRTKPAKPSEQRVQDTAELNDRLFERAWRNGK